MRFLGRFLLDKSHVAVDEEAPIESVVADFEELSAVVRHQVLALKQLFEALDTTDPPKNKGYAGALL